MKAILLWQPWASLWAVDRKRFETRHWVPPYRGALSMHAAQKLCIDLDDELVEICRAQFGIHRAREFPREALLATSRLVGCHRTDTLTGSAEECAQRTLTLWRYARKAVEKTMLPRAIPFRGHQSIFDVPKHVLGRAFPLAPIGQFFE
jgi:hypothetical protein